MAIQATWKRAITIKSVPPRILAITGAASMLGAILAILQGWPIWAVGLVVVLPWVPILTSEVVWTYRHYHWLALFYLLVVTQGGHVLEHVAQMVQIHLLGLKGPAARGVFGALDVEWVHFVWNTWVLVATIALVARFRKNPWLWGTAAFAAWHEAEHVVMIITYLSTGKAGTPGLLAMGGVVAGGLPVNRPNLHFFYNLIETMPLVAGFVWQLRRAHDQWLLRALPRVPHEVLAEFTDRLTTVRFAPGQAIVRQDELPDRFYVVVRGEVGVTQARGGTTVELTRLGPGEFFGEVGLLENVPRTASVTARTRVELLVLDREAFRSLLARSAAASEDLSAASARRFARTSTGPT